METRKRKSFGKDGKEDKRVRTRLSSGTLIMTGTSTATPPSSKPPPPDSPPSVSNSSTASSEATAPAEKKRDIQDTPSSSKRKYQESVESSEEGSGSSVPPKQRKIGRNNGTGEDNKNDYFCWVCHQEGLVICCELCPRVYHTKCLNIDSIPQDWVCPECEKIMQAECVDTRSKVMSLISIDRLCALMKFALDHMRAVGAEAFEYPVNPNQFPTYSDYVYHPVCLSQLEKNIKKKVYGCTEALLADAKWIYHNSYVFNGAQSKVTQAARTLLKVCKHEMSEIEVCPDCYWNSCAQSNKDWFCEPCSTPHPLVWAKLKGYPFWPAKVLREVNGQVDVRFFGAHDRSWVPVSSCHMLSKQAPVTMKKSRGGFEQAMEEVQIHITKLREKFGGFSYAPPKTNYNKKCMDIMMKNTRGKGEDSSSSDSQSVASKTAMAVKSKYSSLASKKSTTTGQQKQVIYLKPMQKGVFRVSETATDSTTNVSDSRPHIPELQLAQDSSDIGVTSSSSAESMTKDPKNRTDVNQASQPEAGGSSSTPPKNTENASITGANDRDKDKTTAENIGGNNSSNDKNTSIADSTVSASVSDKDKKCGDAEIIPGVSSELTGQNASISKETSGQICTSSKVGQTSRLSKEPTGQISSSSKEAVGQISSLSKETTGQNINISLEVVGQNKTCENSEEVRLKEKDSCDDSSEAIKNPSKTSTLTGPSDERSKKEKDISDEVYISIVTKEKFTVSLSQNTKSVSETGASGEESNSHKEVETVKTASTESSQKSVSGQDQEETSISESSESDDIRKTVDCEKQSTVETSSTNVVNKTLTQNSVKEKDSSDEGLRNKPTTVSKNVNSTIQVIVEKSSENKDKSCEAKSDHSVFSVSPKNSNLGVKVNLDDNITIMEGEKAGAVVKIGNCSEREKVETVSEDLTSVKDKRNEKTVVVNESAKLDSLDSQLEKRRTSNISNTSAAIDNDKDVSQEMTTSTKTTVGKDVSHENAPQQTLIASSKETVSADTGSKISTSTTLSQPCVTVLAHSHQSTFSQADKSNSSSGALDSTQENVPQPSATEKSADKLSLSNLDTGKDQNEGMDKNNAGQKIGKVTDANVNSREEISSTESQISPNKDSYKDSLQNLIEKAKRNLLLKSGTADLVEGEEGSQSPDLLRHDSTKDSESSVLLRQESEDVSEGEGVDSVIMLGDEEEEEDNSVEEVMDSDEEEGEGPLTIQLDEEGDDNEEGDKEGGVEVNEISERDEVDMNVTKEDGNTDGSLVDKTTGAKASEEINRIRNDRGEKGQTSQVSQESAPRSHKKKQKTPSTIVTSDNTMIISLADWDSEESEGDSVPTTLTESDTRLFEKDLGETEQLSTNVMLGNSAEANNNNKSHVPSNSSSVNTITSQEPIVVLDAEQSTFTQSTKNANTDITFSENNAPGETQRLETVKTSVTQNSSSQVLTESSISQGNSGEERDIEKSCPVESQELVSRLGLLPSSLSIEMVESERRENMRDVTLVDQDLSRDGTLTDLDANMGPQGDAGSTCSVDSPSERSMSPGVNEIATGMVNSACSEIQKLLSEKLFSLAQSIEEEAKKRASSSGDNGALIKDNKVLKKRLSDTVQTAQKCLLEAQAAFEKEKQKLKAGLEETFKKELAKMMVETKRQQWCAECLKEAVYYCCWNTSYCSYNCQQKHWPSHMAKCLQSPQQQQQQFPQQQQQQQPQLLQQPQKQPQLLQQQQQQMIKKVVSPSEQLSGASILNSQNMANVVFQKSSQQPTSTPYNIISSLLSTITTPAVGGLPINTGSMAQPIGSITAPATALSVGPARFQIQLGPVTGARPIAQPLQMMAPGNPPLIVNPGQPLLPPGNVINLLPGQASSLLATTSQPQTFLTNVPQPNQTSAEHQILFSNAANVQLGSSNQ